MTEQHNALIAQALQQGTGAEQYLSFHLAGETYGIDILRVQEIRGWEPVTQIPETPDFIKGILNLRGSVVPIVDLRDRFHLEHREYSNTTVVIVVSIYLQEQQRLFGMVVDGVEDVLDIKDEDVKAAPEFGTAVNTEFISGLADVQEKMVMLLDIDRMLTQQESEALAQIESDKEPEAPAE